ncbi:MAG: hypothetical protein PHW65_00135 [Dehalococcoidales bacterium]|nr:hypothetical protein [Dehalococcoidales bacterium]
MKRKFNDAISAFTAEFIKNRGRPPQSNESIEFSAWLDARPQEYTWEERVKYPVLFKKSLLPAFPSWEKIALPEMAGAIRRAVSEAQASYSNVPPVPGWIWERIKSAEAREAAEGAARASANAAIRRQQAEMLPGALYWFNGHGGPVSEIRAILTAQYGTVKTPVPRLITLPADCLVRGAVIPAGTRVRWRWVLSHTVSGNIRPSADVEIA